MHNTPSCPSVGEISKEFCFEHARQPVRTLLGLCARGVMLVILKIDPSSLSSWSTQPCNAYKPAHVVKLAPVLIGKHFGIGKFPVQFDFVIHSRVHQGLQAAARVRPSCFELVQKIWERMNRQLHVR